MQKGGFGGCSSGTRTGTRVRSPKPPFYETALLSPSEPMSMIDKRVVSKRVVLADAGETKVSTSTVAALFSKNGLDRPKNRYGRYGFPSFNSISMSTVGVDGARVCL